MGMSSHTGRPPGLAVVVGRSPARQREGVAHRDSVATITRRPRRYGRLPRQRVRERFTRLAEPRLDRFPPERALPSIVSTAPQHVDPGRLRETESHTNVISGLLPALESRCRTVNGSARRDAAELLHHGHRTVPSPVHPPTNVRYAFPPLEARAEKVRRSCTRLSSSRASSDSSSTWRPVPPAPTTPRSLDEVRWAEPHSAPRPLRGEAVLETERRATSPRARPVAAVALLDDPLS